MSADHNEEITNPLMYSPMVTESIFLALSGGDPDNPDDPCGYDVKLMGGILKQLEEDLGPNLGRSIFMKFVVSLPDRRPDLFYSQESLHD
jgi:hypothetical protein